MWQVILYPILVFLMVLGCFTVYQRETNILRNQALLASKIESVRMGRDADNRQLGGHLQGFNARLIAVENQIRTEEKKK